MLEEDAPVFKLIGPVSASSVPHSCSAQCVHEICGTDSLNQIPLPPCTPLLLQVLVKQELMEVRNNVQKRVEFIKSDIKRLEGIVKNYETQLETVKGNISALQKANAGK